MNTHDIRQKQYELSVNSGMNQRYHQFKTTRWAMWDRGFRILVGLFAVAGAILTSITAAVPESSWIPVSIVIAALAAFLAVVLNVLPFADWERDHLDLFRRWADLREEVDALLFDIDGATNDDMPERLKRIECKGTRIDALEPAPDETFLKKCYKDEMDSRKPDRSNCESDEVVAATC